MSLPVTHEDNNIELGVVKKETESNPRKNKQT